LGDFRALREEEKLRNRVNKRLPKLVEELERLAEKYIQDNGKDFLICGTTFANLNYHQQERHDMAVQNEKDSKKEEKKKIMMQESLYGVTKTPIRGGNRTIRQVKRLQHDSRLVKVRRLSVPKSRKSRPHLQASMKRGGSRY
jgi:hypothetical protein